MAKQHVTQDSQFTIRNPRTKVQSLSLPSHAKSDTLPNTRGKLNFNSSISTFPKPTSTNAAEPASIKSMKKKNPPENTRSY